MEAKRKKFNADSCADWGAYDVYEKLTAVMKWVEKQDDKDSIDYFHIIKLLRQNNFNDFNMFPKVSTYWDLCDLMDTVERAYDNEVPLIKRNCKDCGEEFFIYISERDDYLNKGLQLPKRCKSCRRANKQKKAV